MFTSRYFAGRYFARRYFPARGGVGLPVIKSGVNATAPWHAIRDQKGITYMANGVDRPQAWNGLAATTRNWGINAPSLTATVAAVSAGAITGTYFMYYSFYNSSTGVYGNPSPITAAITASAQKIRITGFHASASDSQVDYVRFWRNTDGQAATFYLDGAKVIGSTSYTTNVTDAVLSSGDTLEFDHDPPDSQRPFVAFHQGRAHQYGSRVEQAGTIAASGTAVTGTSTDFRASHVGQTLVVPGYGKQHVVSAVVNSTSITLVDAVSGSIAAGSSYRMFPAATRSAWGWSESGAVEYFPAANTTNVYEADGDEPTGLFICQSQLFAAKRRHVYRLMFQNDPNPVTGDGGIFPVLQSRGLVNQRCAVSIGSEAYLLDETGIYLFNGSSTVQDIDPAIKRLLQPSTEPVAERVNWAVKHKFHGIYDPKRDRVLFFVALGTDTEPKNAFVWERQRQRWTVEEYRVGITASCLMEDGNGKQRAWVGDENGLIWALGVSNSIDGAPPAASGTLRGTATSADSTSLTDSGASFYTTGDGLIGVPVYIYSGTGSGQWRIIQTNTGTKLNVSVAWTTTPDDTSEYRVGAIDFQIKSKWFSMNEPAYKKRLTKFKIFFEPQSDDQILGVTVYHDFSTTAFKGWVGQQSSTRGDGLEIPSTATTDGELYVHLNETKGYVEVPIGAEYVNFVRFQLRMIETGRKPAILGYEFPGMPIQGSGRLGG